MEPEQVDTLKKNVLEELEKQNGIVTVSCNNVGLSRSTFYLWCNIDADFKSKVDDLQEVAIDYVEGKLFEKIRGVQIGKYDSEGELQVYDQPPSDTAIIFYLKTKGKKRGYIERSEFDHTTKGEKLGQQDLSKYTDEELRTIAELQRKGGTS